MRVLVTGAGGFVGTALTQILARNGLSVLVVSRRSPESPIPWVGETIVLPYLAAPFNWVERLSGVDAVIHLAARAHVTSERNPDPLAAFRAINVAPTVALFEAAQRAGVGRFIFVSSIGVNGSETTTSPFCESDIPNPSEDYAKSKWEAEQVLLDHTSTSSASASGDRTQLTILRPSLIYGPGAKGNFFRLMQWVERGWPFPIAHGEAERSFMSLSDFCELVLICLTHPAAVGETFVAADDAPVTFKRLILVMADAMGSRTRPIAFPAGLLMLVGRILGREAEIQRLTGSLVVDASKARRMLDWPARASFDLEVAAMVRSFKREGR